MTVLLQIKKRFKRNVEEAEGLSVPDKGTDTVTVNIC